MTEYIGVYVGGNVWKLTVEHSHACHCGEPAAVVTYRPDPVALCERHSPVVFLSWYPPPPERRSWATRQTSPTSPTSPIEDIGRARKLLR